MRWTPVRRGVARDEKRDEDDDEHRRSAAFLAGRVFTIPERSAGSIESTSLMDAAARRLSRSRRTS